MICWTVCLPSQRSTICRLGPLRRSARSGISKVCCRSSFPFVREAGVSASRPRDEACFANRAASRFLGRLEGAGGRPAGIDVRKIESVELRPEDIALGAQRRVRLILFLARARVLNDPGESKLGVFGSLREATREIVETPREPWIVFAETVHSQGD